MTSLDPFFDEAREQSVVKTQIVTKYFFAWAGVMMSRSPQKIAYLDLFSGPGIYKDGTKSTPIIILEKVLNDPKLEELRKILVTKFNDKDPINVKTLREAIDNIPNISSLSYKPQVLNEEVGEKMINTFKGINTIPMLSFIDPWGYKGLTLELIEAMLKSWGCDCIFFFNYNRANMAFNNDAVIDHMKALFGSQRAEELRRKLAPLSADVRELTIIEELSQALRGNRQKPRYVLPFRFRSGTGTRISHHLIFVSKNFLGYHIMKGIMAKESSDQTQGVPSFEYNKANQLQPLLFDLSRLPDRLGDELLKQFAGRSLTVEQIYQEHSVGTPFIIKNYKEALLQLEREQRIQAYCSSRRNPNAFGDKVIAIFPPIEPKP